MTTLEFAEVRTRPRDPAPGRTAGLPPRRSTRGGTFLLPPWTRAPMLAFGQPSVILAVIAAAAILACAAASATLFLSSSSSEALHRIVAASCGDASYPTVTEEPAGKINIIPSTGATSATFPDPTGMERDVPRAMTAAGLATPTRTVSSGEVPVSRAASVTNARLFYGDGALDHVDVLQRTAGQGVLLPSAAASVLSAHPGDTVTMGDRAVQVVGVYRNLYDQALPAYWCSYQSLGLVPCETCGSPPPPVILFTDPTLLDQTYARLGEVSRATTPLNYQWHSPITTDHLTLDGARRIVDQQNDAYRRLGTTLDKQVLGDSTQGQLPKMTDQAARIRSGLTGPVWPIALGGSILALLLVGAAGSYWADRRAREVRLLSARGVGPGGLATKAALELALPMIAGTALGWGLALVLVRFVGPSSVLDPGAPAQAAEIAAAGLLAGLVMLSGVAGLRARNATERPVGARRSWAAMLPWELLLVAAAALCYIRLRSEDAVVLDHNVAQVNLLLVTFPLLFLAGIAVLVVRLLTLLLAPLRRHAGRWPTALYFAVSRITAAPVVSVTLLAAVSMPIAMVVYAGGLTRSSEYTVDAKAKVFSGSDLAVISVDDVQRSPQVDRVATIVQRYEGAHIGGEDATVLAVDPATLPKFAFWDDRFADRPLDTLMTRISATPHGNALPALVVDNTGRAVAGSAGSTVQLGARRLDLDVVDRPTVFPGTRAHDLLVVVSTANLGTVDRSASRNSELWTTGGLAPVQQAMTAQHARVFDTHDKAQVVDVANYLAITWSFGYLEALAALVGLIAIGGLLLYLATRQRTRATSYALSRRMGLSPAIHLRSLLCELGLVIGTACAVGMTLAWTAVLLVYTRMEIDSARPPGPLLAVPVAALVGAAVVSAVVAVLASLMAHRSAQRTDVTEVLRLGS